MQVITLFALKGGCGRTTVTVALASAFLDKGLRVRVVDAGEVPKPSYPSLPVLEVWRDRLGADGIPVGACDVEPLRDGLDFPDIVTRARRTGVDIMLVDTRAESDDPRHHVVLGLSDLVLLPFPGRNEAELIGERLMLFGEIAAPAFGLATGLRGSPNEQDDVVTSFGGRMMRTRLPRTRAFEAVCGEGRLGRRLPYRGGRDATPDGPAELDDEWRSWNAAQDLATAALWATRGFELKRGGRSGICP